MWEISGKNGGKEKDNYAQNTGCREKNESLKSKKKKEKPHIRRLRGKASTILDKEGKHLTAATRRGRKRKGGLHKKIVNNWLRTNPGGVQTEKEKRRHDRKLGASAERGGGQRKKKRWKFRRVRKGDGSRKKKKKIYSATERKVHKRDTEVNSAEKT